MLYSLAGRIAIITGAASGIGMSSAELFAKQGANLILVDKSKRINDVANKISNENKNVKVNILTCDVTNSSQVNGVYDEIKKIYPNNFATILVNSAGIGLPGEFLKMSEKEFDRTIAINLKSAFLMTQPFCKILVENYSKQKFKSVTDTYASIVNLSSQASKVKGLNIAHYAASKAGLDGFTRSVSREMGPYKVRCNSVLPYFIDTPMTDFIQGDLKKAYLKIPAMGRFGKPEEVAQLILFLASDASSYVTGASIDIAG